MEVGISDLDARTIGFDKEKKERVIDLVCGRLNHSGALSLTVDGDDLIIETNTGDTARVDHDCAAVRAVELADY